ncbi:FtsX-like permease family protein [Aquisalimonas lutea]|uniref:ABC transporter permease n=1 Tax=Aquisalimonas lutea TaxID=1327750 RepID=UPI0025B4C20E|nr:FtsX-like permease family protein [Aquisalimonas lutea]MDN3516242.1 FtsX-like permease family protein [Aquisalimonas lutea]
MTAARQGFRLLRRDWRAGEVRLLATAVVLAVTAITAVAWLADRVAAGTEGRAAELLAGDRALVSDRPIGDGPEELARELGLATTRTQEFASVVLAGDETLLTAIKAVGDGYPLRGELLVGDNLDARRVAAEGVPSPGDVWVDPRILRQLGLDPGDPLDVGATTLTIDRVVFLEPDRSSGFRNFAPRVMMHRSDLPATELIQEGSRVRHRLLVAGDPDRVEAWESQVRPSLEQGARIATPGEQDPGVTRAMTAARRFLGLSALLTVVVGGVGMLLTIRRYAARHLDRVAVMRCLGATQRQVVAMLGWKMVWLGLFAGLVGTLLGYLVHALMLALVADLLPPLPGPSLRPALVGLLTAQVILLGFALPTVLRLKRVPPLRVLRRDLGDDVYRGGGVYVFALAAVFALMWWQAGDLQLSLYVLGAVLGTLAALAAAAAVLIRVLRLARGRRGNASLLLSGLVRRPWTAVIQIMALGLGLMALLLLTLVRNDLLATWQDGVPDDAANYFLINIQPGEVEELTALLDDAGVDTTLYPMVRGRLVGINERDVRPSDYEDPRTRRLVAREFNLSWLERLPEDNRIEVGAFWNPEPADPAQYSLEARMAERLGVGVGDVLHFNVAGERYSAPITNIRSVQWDSFNVNFFAVAAPGFLDDAPATYITSFYLPPERSRLLARLVDEFPSVTLIDVSAILDTVRSIMDQGARVVELMALLTLLSGIVVLLAALQVTREERQFESALLRALGARRRLIRRLAVTEFVLLGGVAGLLAGAGATLAGVVISRQLFDLEYAFNPWFPLIGAATGAGVVALAGWLATRRLYRVSPMRLLQDADEA